MSDDTEPWAPGISATSSEDYPSSMPYPFGSPRAHGPV